MDEIFDRLTDLLRSMGQRSGSGSSRPTSSDPDELQAWEELNEFMDGPNTGTTSGTAGTHTGAGGGSATAGSRRRAAGGHGTTGRGSSSAATGRKRIPESLRRDFENLEVPFGAGLEQARAAHRRLIRAYHPDRHASKPDKYRIANKITQRVNYSYQRIKQYYEKGIQPEDQGS